METSAIFLSVLLVFSVNLFCLAQNAETWFQAVMREPPRQVEALIAADANVSAQDDGCLCRCLFSPLENLLAPYGQHVHTGKQKHIKNKAILISFEGFNGGRITK